MAFKSFLSKAKDVDILASLPDGLILIDNNGKIEWINNVIPDLFQNAANKISKSDINDIIESGLDLAKQAVHVLEKSTFAAEKQQFTPYLQSVLNL